MIPRVSCELFITIRTQRVSPSSDYCIPRQGKRPRTRTGLLLRRLLGAQRPEFAPATSASPESPAPVVSTASRAGPFGVVAWLVLAILRSRCAGSPAPICLAADTFTLDPFSAVVCLLSRFLGEIWHKKGHHNFVFRTTNRSDARHARQPHIIP
jgi:hypothetical protein